MSQASAATWLPELFLRPRPQAGRWSHAVRPTDLLESAAATMAVVEHLVTRGNRQGTLGYGKGLATFNTTQLRNGPALYRSNSKRIGTRAEPWSVGLSVSTKSGVPKTGLQFQSAIKTWRKSLHSTSGTLRSCGGSLCSLELKTPTSPRDLPRSGGQPHGLCQLPVPRSYQQVPLVGAASPKTFHFAMARFLLATPKVEAPTRCGLHLILSFMEQRYTNLEP